MRSILSLFIFLLSTWAVYSQKYAFVTYSTKQGLPQSQVTSITQDASGYLWVATLGGLSRFNGESFETYSTNSGLLNNRITTLNYFENAIWVGHDGGISIIRNDQITKYAFQGNDKSRKVSGIVRFKNDIYVSSNGGGLFKLVNDKLEHILLKNSEFESIKDIHVAKDVLYLATRAGILESSNGSDFTLSKEFPEGIYSGIASNGIYTAYSTFIEGVYIRDDRSGKVKFYDPELLNRSIFGCFMDSGSNCWLVSNEGIIVISPSGELTFYNESNGLPSNMISGYYEDQDGNIWIGSQGKGLFRFPGSVFTFYDQSTGLPSDLFLCGFQNNLGEFYLGTIDKGIIYRDKQGNSTRLPVTTNSVWAVLPDVNGRNWFGTQSSLIALSGKNKQEVFDIDDGLPGVKITALYKVSSKEMYIGGSEGVSYYNGHSFERMGTEKSRYIGTVRDFAVLNDMVFCVSNLGLYVFKNGDFQLVDGMSQVVYNLEKDNDDNLWLGTEDGLYRFRQGKVEKVHLLDDPASNMINFLNYRNGELYIGTNNGLFIILNTGSDKPKFKRYGTGEGVVDLETNLNSGFFDKDGNFWFGTASGLISFHPEKSDRRTSAPILNLKMIKLNYQPFDYEKYADSIQENGLPLSLILPFSKNNLIFELDGVSLIHHEGLSYQFMLEGLNNEWSPLSKVASITFTSLPAGDYMLRMRAVDIDGRMSEEIVFPFTINEAFYKTWWFITIVALIVGLIVLSIFRFRVRRIRELNEKEKLEYMTRLLALEQKSVNASMNRHFIFNALNSIQYFINTSDRISANKYLTNFAQLIRKNLDSANSDNNTITLEEELARIKLYLSLEAMRFKDRFSYDVQVEDVDVESIMIPAMIMQPFVENSIIHGILPNEGKYGEILIRVYHEDGYLFISIEDNGIGINQSLSKKTGMEGDHRSQGMEITTKRIELLKKITDSKIELIGPNEIVGNDGSINGTHVLIKIPLSDLEN